MYFFHAIRYLCQSEKRPLIRLTQEYCDQEFRDGLCSRNSLILPWINILSAGEMGRGSEHFLHEASKSNPTSKSH